MYSSGAQRSTKVRTPQSSYSYRKKQHHTSQVSLFYVKSPVDNQAGRANPLMTMAFKVALGSSCRAFSGSSRPGQIHAFRKTSQLSPASKVAALHQTSALHHLRLYSCLSSVTERFYQYPLSCLAVAVPSACLPVNQFPLVLLFHVLYCTVLDTRPGPYCIIPA